MRRIHESSQSYLINQYFVHAKLEQDMMHTSKHRFFLAGLPKLLLSRWYQPLYEPLESYTGDPSSKTYELNKLNLIVYVWMFIMFHEDGKIDKKEMKILKRYVQYVKKYDTVSNTNEVIEFLKSSITIQQFQRIYLKKGYSPSMLDDVLKEAKKRLIHHKYLKSFETLETSVKSL